MFLEQGNYDIDTEGISYGIVKGSKPYDDITSALIGNGRVEARFLITEGDRTKVSLQGSYYSSNAFGNEKQVSGSGKRLQELIDDAFDKYDAILGVESSQTLAEATADNAIANKKLDCNDPNAKDEMIITKRDTPVFSTRSRNAVTLISLTTGVRVMTYTSDASYTTICYDGQKAYVESNRIGRGR